MGVALVIALLMAAVLGLGAHFLVFRPLRHAAPLGKVVASLGLALYLQGVALLNFGTSYPTPKSVYPNPNSAFENFLLNHGELALSGTAAELLERRDLLEASTPVMSRWIDVGRDRHRKGTP